MKLYTFPVAPNPTKVRLYLAEKRAGGAGIEVEEVTVARPLGVLARHDAERDDANRLRRQLDRASDADAGLFRAVEGNDEAHGRQLGTDR